MRVVGYFLILGMIITGCQSGEPEEMLRQETYNLHQANFNPTRGEVTVTEVAPGKLQFTISLINTQEGFSHPAHLHFGSVREVGELALALNPVDGTTGKSETILDKQVLANGEVLTYDLFKSMDGSIKIHVSDGPLDMVLAFGNVGRNEDYFFDGVAVCTGH